MIFKTLKDKCEYYRSLTDYRLSPNGYILVMIDGKNFSKLIKNKFEKPFDDWFIDTMNKTAKHLCKNIQNCVGAFVQSDEISLVIQDNPETCPPFDLRMCKLLSIIPSLATSFFTKQMIIRNGCDCKTIITSPDYVFDCKVWTVPSQNDMIAWFLYRQIDCVRNSKQQFCQTYIPHNQLKNKIVDEQVELCFNETGHDWNSITEDKKYGRFLYKTSKEFENEHGKFIRKFWTIKTLDLTIQENRENLINTWFENE